MPAVSIIVPVYNAAPYLRRCIDSILAQTFSDYECILVDDCSSDNGSAICDEYAQKDNRIKVIHKIQNEGSSFARKSGFDISSGKYIQYVDADDYILPDMLEKIYHYTVLNNFDMLFCDWYKHIETNEILYEKMPPISGDFIQNIKSFVINVGMQGTVWNKLIKRTVHENIEFPKDSFAEDRYIIAQALFFSGNIGYLDAAFYHYMYNQNSLLRSPKKEWNRYNEVSANFSKIIDFLKKNYGEDIGVFEPELGIRLKKIREMHPMYPKRIIKKILRIMVPVRAWRKCLRKVFFGQ